MIYTLTTAQHNRHDTLLQNILSFKFPSLQFIMFAIIFVTLFALPFLLFLWSAFSLYTNKQKAQSTGLPLLIRWVAPTNPLWMMFGSTIVLKCRSLGIGTAQFRRLYLFGWEANERHIIHQELGPAFMLVSPGGNWLCISDASVIAEVLHRRTDFRRNMEQFAVVNVYGKNIATTDDEEWKRHRKVTAITFTEKNNELVWRESLAQAKGMLEYWVEHQPINSVADDTKVFTLNVLAAAIFNKVYPFEAAVQSTAQTGSDTKDSSNVYRDSLGKILTYIIPIFICGEKGLQAWWTPKSWKAAGDAVATFRDYVAGLIREERESIKQGAQKNQHLVAALVRACESDALEDGRSASGMRNMTLTEQEIISNLFIYAFAGNDTTAVSLTSLLIHLAAFPETQEWIAEELQHYLVGDDASQWEYKTFPKLKRCLAVVVGIFRSYR
jgi:cytochrome P450